MTIFDKPKKPKLKTLRFGEIFLVDDISGARVIYVDPSEFPRHPSKGFVYIGLYTLIDHTIKIANNLSSRVEKHTLYHEIAHAMGIRSEMLADRFAETVTGYNPFMK